MSTKLSKLHQEAGVSSIEEESTSRGGGGLAAAGPDDADTSFEIDDPDDEETIDDVITINKRHGIGVGVDAAEMVKSILNNVANNSACCTCGKSVGVAENSRKQTNVSSLIDNAAEEEREACMFCQSRRRTLTRNTATVSPLSIVHIKDNDDSLAAQSDADDAQSASSSSSSAATGSQTATGSSTPTTADVAEISLALAPIGRENRMENDIPKLDMTVAKLMPRIPANAQNRLSYNGSTGDDNLSASIATTTTEVDMDVVATVSPNNMQRLKHLQQMAAATTYPSAALRQVDLGTEAGRSSTAAEYESPNAGHQRTLSASSYRSLGSQSLASHTAQPAVQRREPKMWIFEFARWICIHFKSSGIGEPSVYHALVVIFLEFFAWGLLTMPVIAVLNQTFPDHTFLMNGLVMGIKGILSFLSAPLIGALSDIWGRKFFLLITVFFTCAPIPLMTINTWWFFAMISISGVFAVTFSVVFAYVADVTSVEERSKAYGLVSATFAASLVISPALGAALMEMYTDTLVVALATAIAVLDVFFILVAVPESLPEKVRPSSWGAPISWEQADPFAALRKVGTDHTILMQCVTVLLSYLPEAGQYSCIFVYLKLKMGFNSMEVAIFIALVGILSISVQVTLGYLMRVFGAKRTIILGLVLEMMQLLWYGFGSQVWMMWAAGVLAALGSITYPAISAFVSIHSNADQQGAVQGMVTGMRGLCNGLGPAMFGVIFYLFNVDLNADNALSLRRDGVINNETSNSVMYSNTVPGPPFAFGALMVVLAILVAVFIPEARREISLSRAPSEKKRVSVDLEYEIECDGYKTASPLSPLMHSESFAKL